MKKNYLIIIAVVVLLVVGVCAFYCGMLYGKSQNARPFGNMQGIKNGKINGGGSNFISGDIISKDNNSITLQLSNNSGSKIIFFSSKTQINKSAAATSDDLAKGTSVSITGTTNSDGSVTAQSIQIKPSGQNTRPEQNNPVQ